VRAGARRQALLAECASNLKQIGIATHNYAADNRDYLPPWREEFLIPYATHGTGTPNNLVQTQFGNSFWGDPGGTYAIRVNTGFDSGSNIMCLKVTGYLGAWNWAAQNTPLKGQIVYPTGPLLRGGNGSVSQNGITVAGNAFNPSPFSDRSFFPIRWCPAQAGNSTNGNIGFSSDYIFNPHWIYVDPSITSSCNKECGVAQIRNWFL